MKEKMTTLMSNIRRQIAVLISYLETCWIRSHQNLARLQITSSRCIMQWRPALSVHRHRTRPCVKQFPHCIWKFPCRHVQLRRHASAASTVAFFKTSDKLLGLSRAVLLPGEFCLQEVHGPTHARRHGPQQLQQLGELGRHDDYRKRHKKIGNSTHLHKWSGCTDTDAAVAAYWRRSASEEDGRRSAASTETPRTDPDAARRLG